MKIKRISKGKKHRFVLTGDLHFRYDKPVCYKDEVDWIELQKKAIQFLASFKCPIICSGDFFDRAKQPVWFLREIMKEILRTGAQIFSVYGNHDLFGVGHNISRYKETSLELLNSAEALCAYNSYTKVLNGVVFHMMEPEQKSPIDTTSAYEDHSHFAVIHEFVYKGKEPYPGCPIEHEYSNLVDRIAPDNPNLLGIITGDNHQSFIGNGCPKVINPGCLMWQKISESEYTPKVYIMDVEGRDLEITGVECKFLRPEFLTREHLMEQEDKEQRLSAFVSRLNRDMEVGLSFEDNLEQYRKANKVEKRVMDIIYKSMTGE